VGTPLAETVIRGPQEGFTENIRTNSALIRRKIKTPKLIFENMIFGEQSRTAVLLVYIDGIVNQEILQQIKEKIASIDTGIVLETGHIEQHLDPNNFSPFSGIGLTQKPDKVAQKISEGRVAILCDGTPECLYIPELFIENIQTVEDYYNRPLYASIIRLLRLMGLAITVFVPGFSAAILTFNQEMLPSVFLTSIINSTQKTPMPIAFEIILLTLMFELLKEAGTRLPKEVGSAITIVGSLIIGDAAVNAGIVSAPSVIVVALTAVTSFIVPNLFEFTIIYRALFWLLGSTMGIIGLGAGLFIMLTQVISQRSFGIPVLSSFSKEELKDSFVRLPFALLKYRPKSIARGNVRRRK
jgi:spore germination protein KA